MAETNQRGPGHEVRRYVKATIFEFNLIQINSPLSPSGARGRKGKNFKIIVERRLIAQTEALDPAMSITRVLEMSATTWWR